MLYLPTYCDVQVEYINMLKTYEQAGVQTTDDKSWKHLVFQLCQNN